MPEFENDTNRNATWKAPESGDPSRLRRVLDFAKRTGDKATQSALEIKDRAGEVFSAERFGLLLDTLQATLASDEAQRVIQNLPFAGALSIGEAGVGKTLTGKPLSGLSRMKHAVLGARSMGVDLAGGKVLKGVKFAATAMELTPALLKSLGQALLEKNIKGADTIIVLADFMEKHPKAVGLLRGKFFKNK